MRYILGIFIALLIAGCGYKPVSKITQDIMGESIYVDVIISKTEPKNSVWIKDAVKEGMVARLNRSLSDDKNADTSIIVSIKSLSYEATVYDEKGYITSYKAILNLNYKTKFKDGRVVDIPASGEYDFSVARRQKSTRYADSVISDTDKYEAIKEASKEAFDEYIANLAVKGYKNGSHNR
ncbi:MULTISPECIES: LPS assembly lipoprotein LptE [Campylobacter]|uniref:LPS assembly lipoprotein LptE n=1 Tax=Campylobacter TaxID=194 RepID=UPI00027A3A01|nr:MULTISPECIES: LPS assembly lipoprotein LptE [Campylobacter]EJP74354.1 rare lipoprotein B family protein [Campylobacter sp. FOBRC14]